ncbi:hypothetical protein F4679DRAFT_286522 [Xylaria curta]|nr:hypothetical protein F4679DRAFT_286522 [Xylaria curta]
MLIVERAPSIAEEYSDVQDVAIRGHHNDEGVSMEQMGKEKATTTSYSSEIIAAFQASPDAFMVDWTRYEPPEGLKYTGDVESDVGIRIVQESIERIKARILEEEQRQKSVAETPRLGQEEETASEGNEEAKQHGSDDALRGGLGEADELHQPAAAEQDASGSVGTGSFPADLPKRPRKRTLMNLFRKLNGGPEPGESSAAGAARHRILMSSSTAEFTTHSARRRFVVDLIKKATGDDCTSSGPSTPGPEVECVSCLDDFDPKDTVRAPCHNYCTPCFRRLVVSACRNEQHWPPKCCLNNIPHSTILANVDEAQRSEYRERAREWNVPVADRIYCSQPECSLFIRPEYVIPAQDLARCTDGHYTCTICRNAQHEGDVCPQDKDVLRTNELAAEEGWKRCYGCRAYVEHREACQHMTCRCGAEFCYVCGARWRTCACTMTQLAALKEHAASRRQKRLDKEAAEEAAIQEAVRLVEEYEREEELKAELLRQERARLAEERQRAELEARIRREGERRRAVTLRFEELRATFEDLHATQQTIVAQTHEKREQQLAQKSEEAFRRLFEMHELERELQRAKVEARIAEREEKFRAEYVARLAEERQIEEQYAAKLRTFWGGRKGGEEKVRAALLDLQVKMNEGFKVWKIWMDGELDTYHHHVREELAIGEELMDEKERRVRSRAREAALALATRNAAELRWVREVMEERGRMLRELESDEMENGDDIDTWFAEGPLEEALAANPWR